MPAFITIRFLDILDIFLVAFLLYQVYRLIKGTVAFNIVIGLFSLYLVWIVVKALNMQLLGSIMGQFIGVGVLALIIVFHPEIRKFLVFIGTNYNVNRIFMLDKLFTTGKQRKMSTEHITELAEGCRVLAETFTGALIVITRDSELLDQKNTGETVRASVSKALLTSIFYKNSPLHDGAAIITGYKIVAVRCILPLSQKQLKNKDLGLRHRAAIGITENTDALAIVVSEERGQISFAVDGKLEENITLKQLINRLEKLLNPVSEE
ncbi:MAG: diadenylate cyclase CdaA [Prolixibacteraceae bacterium]|nr:diadenylate cyclase CdaA [Prolixibacteraceae bacterium]